MAIRNINPELGDNVIFESVEEMEQAIRELESKNGGEWMPEDGLKEGRDYETVRTRYEVWENGHKLEVFASLEKAQDYMTSHGYQYIDFMACDHPFEYRHYYLPIDWNQKYSTSQEAFEELYGFGYEPNITPVEV